MSGQRGLRVALIGATGAVGTQILEVLGERRFPVTELLAFASPESAGGEIEFRGESERVRVLDPARVASCDLVLCAAPHVLIELRPALVEAGTRVVDVSGVLEADPAVPLWSPGLNPSGRWIAVPRGVAAGLAPALAALASAAELTRVTLSTFEPASGAGLAGAIELADQTSGLLGRMTGEAPEGDVFSRPLAFDCLPLIGEPGPDGESTAELELRQVLRRALAAPALPFELTRVRVPTLSGSLATVHVALSHALDAARAAELWSKQPGLRVLAEGELPTPRAAVEADAVLIGRVRAGREDAPALAFALAIDDLRRGAAVPAVEAAERLIAARAWRGVLRLRLEYDGTDFCGWQLQAGDRTVQGELEAAFAQIVGQPVRVHGAGRTDAGVHARGQVAHADPDTRLEPGEMQRALNAVLPPDVAVLELTPAAPDFDARGDARWKRYVYRILERRPASPLRRRMTWHHRGALELEPMLEAAKQLEGSHDFAAFQGHTGAAPDGSTVRKLLRLDLRREADELVILAEGQAFLRHMVRNLVGTLVEVGRGRLEPGAIQRILDSRDRSQAGPTAPACGLCLDHIDYGAGSG